MSNGGGLDIICSARGTGEACGLELFACTRDTNGGAGIVKCDELLAPFKCGDTRLRRLCAEWAGDRDSSGLWLLDVDSCGALGEDGAELLKK